MTNRPQILPAPPGWAFHAVLDWDGNEQDPVHEVHPLIGFALFDDGAEETPERPQEMVGVFLGAETRLRQGGSRPELVYTDAGWKADDDRGYALGIYAPGSEPEYAEVRKVRQRLLDERRQRS